jgi:hypothetical protein
MIDCGERITPKDVAALPKTPPETSWNRLWLAADVLNHLRAERSGATIERRRGRRPLSVRRKLEHFQNEPPYPAARR